MKYLLLAFVLFFPLKATCQLATPIGGEQNKDWWIWSYFDNDTTVGSVSNFKCSQYVYDNWFGLVYMLKNLQLMDKGVPVLAAANGTVISTRDGYIDRTKRTDSGGRGNYIRIKHEIQKDTFYTLYANLRNQSIRVKDGQAVKQGDTIAFVGSSGNVYEAKLYFRVEDTNGGKFIDPLGYECGTPSYPALLKPSPIYDTTFGIIDEGITNNPAFTADTLMERPPTLTEISLLDDVYACAWIELKNLYAGDLVQTIWTAPDGSTVTHTTFPIPSSDDHVGYRSNWNHTYKFTDTGMYSVEWFVNSDSVTIQYFHVVEQHSGVVQTDPIFQPLVFPQPSTDHLTISGVTTKEAHLYNIEGIENPVIFEQVANGTVFSWHNLPPGVYYLSIKDFTGQFQRIKVLISH